MHCVHGENNKLHLTSGCVITAARVSRAITKQEVGGRAKDMGLSRSDSRGAIKGTDTSSCWGSSNH